jgi:uncharacterized protein YgiM (DUF1202 family)
MRSSQAVAISLSVFLSAGLLTGCGQNDSTAETLNPGATVGEADSNSSTADESESDAAESGQSSSAATKPAKPSAASEVTTINPPQAAILTAQEDNAQINLRSQPTVQSASKGYGLVGDSVRLLKASEGNNGLTWYLVKFDESGAEGWIRGDFVNTSGTAASNTVSNGQAGVSLDTFSSDELFAVGGGGCGMSLWSTRNNESIFFNGLEDTGMWMKLDGDMTQFRRTTASGPEFYGQSASQSFVSLEGDAQVDTMVQVGTEKGYEAVNIESGTLRLETANGVEEMAVEGDAGC